jgi:hypothetical protein
VNENGKLSDFRLIKGISPDCDQEAVRVLSSGEDWEPGKQRGVAVKQRMVIPIVFKLNEKGATGHGLGEVTEKLSTILVAGRMKVEGEKRYVVGRVTDRQGQPLVGMNIVLEGTTLGTVSDRNGHYALEVQQTSAVLVFSFVGYQTERIVF